jgi:hypothetical protein
VWNKINYARWSISEELISLNRSITHCVHMIFNDKHNQLYKQSSLLLILSHGRRRRTDQWMQLKESSERERDIPK